MMRGELGQPPGGWPADIQAKALKGETPITVRASSLMADEDLEARRAEVTETLQRPANDRDLASYLMYPKVWTDFAGAQDAYGPTEVLPTPVYFYGLPAGEELLLRRVNQRDGRKQGWVNDRRVSGEL